MGARDVDLKQRAIRYDDVDYELPLAPGSVRCIEETSRKYGYVPVRRGRDTMLFEEQQGSALLRVG